MGTENNLITVTDIFHRKRAEAHHDANRLSIKRKSMANAQFRSALSDHVERKTLRDLREELNDPGCGNFWTDKHLKAFGHNEKFIKDWRIYQNNRNIERLAADQAMELKIDEKKYTKAAKTAQRSMEERTRWRFQHQRVQNERKAEEDGLVRGFEEKQQKRSNKIAGQQYRQKIRNEIHVLRETHRLLSERQASFKTEIFEEHRCHVRKEKVKKERGNARKQFFLMASLVTSRSSPEITSC